MTDVMTEKRKWTYEDDVKWLVQHGFEEHSNILDESMLNFDREIGDFCLTILCRRSVRNYMYRIYFKNTVMIEKHGNAISYLLDSTTATEDIVRDALVAMMDLQFGLEDFIKEMKTELSIPGKGGKSNG